jgi:hypothetical protein
LVLGIFKDAISVAEVIRYMVSNVGVMVYDEFEMSWKETAVDYFNVLSQRLPEGTEENYDKSRSG